MREYRVPSDLQEKLALHLTRVLLRGTIMRCQTYLSALNEGNVTPLEKDRARQLLNQARFIASTTYRDGDKTRIDHTFDMEYSAEMLADLVRLLGGDPLVPPPPPTSVPPSTLISPSPSPEPKKKKKKGKKGKKGKKR